MRGLNKIKPSIQAALKYLFFILYSLFGASLLFDLSGGTNKLSFMAMAPVSHKPERDLQSFPVIQPTIKYGIAVDTFQVIEKTIKRNEFLADILLRHQVDYPSIEQLVKNAEGIFDIRTLREGKKYAVFGKDSLQKPDYFIYEPSVYEYIVFDLKDNFKVKKVERPVATAVKTAKGTIESSLWNTMVDNGLSFDLAVEMEKALQWSIDFHHVQKGDEFKLVYEEKSINGEPVGIGMLNAAYFKNEGTDFFALFFDGAQEDGYYNLEGKPMKKAFLKAPVQYTRISSSFSLSRYHPILKRRKAHLGTDYAAPHGTPIFAVGDGVVTQASYTGGNGNFVKIKHAGEYETQYLHMSGFAKGIHSGVHVRQGDVIGYVGSTGLATGPHVCFRFWKNGKQINHLKLNFPAKDPLPVAELPSYFKIRDEYLTMMGFDKEKMNLPSFENIAQIKADPQKNTQAAP